MMALRWRYEKWPMALNTARLVRTYDDDVTPLLTLVFAARLGSVSAWFPSGEAPPGIARRPTDPDRVEERGSDGASEEASEEASEDASDDAGELLTRRLEVVFDIALPRERVWAVMADTQHLNQVFFGLSSGTVVARDGDKARLRGTFGFLAPEYDEYPWSFDVPRQYKNMRVFTSGVLKTLETECALEEVGSTTKVRYLLAVEGSGPFGSLVSAVVVHRVKRGLGAVREMLEKQARSTLPSSGAVQWPPANPEREAVLARARAIADALRLDAGDVDALDRVVLHVADAADADVARMRPYELADAWAMPRKAMLQTFLRAAKGGLLRLSWDVLCPSCEAPSSVDQLKDLPAGGHCPACDIDFETGFDQNVEATFRPEPQVRQAERLVFCHGSPASTKTWLAQFVVPGKGQHILQLRLSAGRYRLQGQGVQKPSLIDVVSEDGAPSCSVALTRSERGISLSQLPALAAGDLSIVIDNNDDQPHRVQLAHRAFASQAATAADVTSLGLYKELFGREVLAADQHVSVGQTAIVFTDLCGSTAMYERVGDAAAYGLVRQHFKLLFAAVEAHHGRVVKTVGDCVMASFDLPADAVRAGFACITALRELKDHDGGAPQLGLKVGVHTGACLAIEANGGIDYFGRTVNIAARVESIARPDELVLSWAVMAAADVKGVVDEFAAAGHTVEVDHKHVKGIDGEVEVVRIGVAVHPRPKAAEAAAVPSSSVPAPVDSPADAPAGPPVAAAASSGLGQ